VPSHESACAAFFTCGCTGTILAYDQADKLPIRLGEPCDLCGGPVRRYDLLDMPAPAAMLLTRVEVAL
jgi:hypothetical protein